MHTGVSDERRQEDDGRPPDALGINQRLSWLLQQLAGPRTPSMDLNQRAVLQRRLLAAFQEGRLGQYVLDEV